MSLARLIVVVALYAFGGPALEGFGLALMMQALGLLAGAGSAAGSDYGYLFIAFKPELMGPPDVFEKQITALIDRVKASPRQAGVDEIRIPSERSRRTRERLSREGIDIDGLVYRQLDDLRRRANARS